MRIPLAAAVCLLLFAAPAEAFQSCTYEAGVVTATFGTHTGGSLSQSGTAIHADGVPCGAATTANTDTINVVGDGDLELLTLDLAGGTFLGGATDEPGTSDEIEINADLGAGRPDYDVLIYGTPGADHITLGQLASPARSAVNLNANEGDGIDPDVVFAGEMAVQVSALAGHDVLGSAGGDGIPDEERFAVLFGGEGNDDFEVSGFSEATPGPGNDTMRFMTPSLGRVSYYEAPAGIQATLQADAVPDPEPDGGTLPGGDGYGGTDTFHGWPGSIDGSNAAADTVDGSDDDDVIRGHGGADVIDGRGGPDLLFGGAAGDTIHGGGDVDQLRGGAGNDLLFGDEGDDALEGGTGDDQESGGDGDDVIRQAGVGQPGVPNGADDVSGGAGTDRVEYGDPSWGGFGGPPVGRTAAVAVDLDDVADDGASGEGDNVHADVEDVTGGAGDDTLVGDADANVLSGFAGADQLIGGDGNDRLEGLAATDQVVEDEIVDGADRLDGGAGADTINGNEGDDAIAAVDMTIDTVDCGAGSDSGAADWNDLLTGCEAIALVAPPTPEEKPSPSPTPAPTPTPIPVVEPPATLPAAATLVTIPSTKRCVSRRRLRLRVKRSVAGTVRSVEVHVNGKRRARVVGRRIGLPVDLRGLPRGRFRVRLKITLADGRVVSDTRRYRTCRPKRRQ